MIGDRVRDDRGQVREMHRVTDHSCLAMAKPYSNSISENTTPAFLVASSSKVSMYSQRD